MRGPGVHGAGGRRPDRVDAAPNGGIEVSGGMRGDIVIQAKVTASAESQQRARDILAAVRVDAASDKVSADGPQGMDRREGWSVSYRLAVPTQTSLELKTVNGGISIEQRRRPARVHDRQRRGQAVGGVG